MAGLPNFGEAPVQDAFLPCGQGCSPLQPQSRTRPGWQAGTIGPLRAIPANGNARSFWGSWYRDRFFGDGFPFRLFLSESSHQKLAGQSGSRLLVVALFFSCLCRPLARGRESLANKDYGVSESGCLNVIGDWLVLPEGRGSGVSCNGIQIEIF